MVKKKQNSNGEWGVKMGPRWRQHRMAQNLPPPTSKLKYTRLWGAVSPARQLRAE